METSMSFGGDGVTEDSEKENLFLEFIGTICYESDCNGKLQDRCTQEICKEEKLSSIVKGLQKRFGEDYIEYQINDVELYAQVSRKEEQERNYFETDRGNL